MTRKWYDARDNKMPWRVTVRYGRTGSLIDVHRFADAFVASL